MTEAQFWCSLNFEKGELMNTKEIDKMFDEPIFVGIASELTKENLEEVDLDKLLEEEEKNKAEAEKKEG